MGIVRLCVLVAVGVVTQTSCQKVTDGSKLRTLADSLPTSGVYAKQLIFANKSVAAGLTITNKTERLQLVQLSQVNGKVEVKAKVCSVRSVGSGGSQLSFPAAFLKSMPESIYSYEIDSSSGKSRLTSPHLVEVFGARLNDAAREALPKSKTDPRVFDQDNDGHPGMSVNLKVGIGPFTAAGQVYLVQRAAWKEMSTSVTSDSVSGTMDISLDQETLGSDSPILGSVSPKVEALSNLSSFTLKRLPEGATCETVLKDAGRLFGELKI